MKRLVAGSVVGLGLVAAAAAWSLPAQSANMSSLPDIKAGQNSAIQLAGCVKICGTYGKCWRNGHRVRCCTRWICRY
jgi:hypothetical protein